MKTAKAIWLILVMLVVVLKTMDARPVDDMDDISQLLSDETVALADSDPVVDRSKRHAADMAISEAHSGDLRSLLRQYHLARILEKLRGAKRGNVDAIYPGLTGGISRTQMDSGSFYQYIDLLHQLGWSYVDIWNKLLGWQLAARTPFADQY